MKKYTFLVLLALFSAIQADIIPPSTKVNPDKNGVTSIVNFTPNIYHLEFIQQENGSFKPSLDNITLAFDRKEPSTFCSKIKEVTASIWSPSKEYTGQEFEVNGSYSNIGGRMVFNGKTYKQSAGSGPGYCNFDQRLTIPTEDILSILGTRSIRSLADLQQKDVCNRYYQGLIPNTSDTNYPRPVYIEVGFNGIDNKDSYTTESRRILVSIKCNRSKPELAREIYLRNNGKYMSVDPSNAYVMKTTSNSPSNNEKFWLSPFANSIKLQSVVGGKYLCQNSASDSKVYGAYNYYQKNSSCSDPKMEILSLGRINLIGFIWTPNNGGAKDSYWSDVNNQLLGIPTKDSQSEWEMIDAASGRPVELNSGKTAKDNTFSLTLKAGSLQGAKLNWKLIRTSDGSIVNPLPPNQGTLVIRDFVDTEYMIDFNVTYEGKTYNINDQPTVLPNKMVTAIRGIQIKEVGDLKDAKVPANRSFKLVEDRKSFWYEVDFNQYLSTKITPLPIKILK